MKNRALSITTAFIFSMAFFTGCSKKLPSLEEEEDVFSNDKNVYNIIYFEGNTTLNYLKTDTEVDYALCANLVDNLVDFDSYGNIVPALAESWSSNDDMTVWTFNIRKGVKWVDCTGAEVADVTADDWVAAAQYVNNAINEADNQYIYNTGGIVHNAQNYYDYTEYMLISDGGKNTVDENGEEIVPVEKVNPEDIGVKALNDYTLVYTLDSPCPFFLSCLSYSSYLPVNRQFLEKSGDMFGRGKENILFNGAFILSEYIPQEKRILLKNDTYWDKAHVYIDEINAKFRKDIKDVTPESFLSGEVDKVLIDNEVIDEWMSNPDIAPQIHSMRPDIAYSYFYSFNFNPQFGAAYEPDNWRKAVVNDDFRKSIMYALDNRALAEVNDPYNPDILLLKTVTPNTFVSAGGKDYTEFAPFKNIQAENYSDAAKAQKYRDKARTALKAEGVSFPIKVLLPYNPSVINWADECALAEKMLEKTLGNDYVDVIVERGPDTGFLSAVRRSGMYAILLCNYGADFDDPATYTEPFIADNTYNFWDKSGDSHIDALFEEYNQKCNEAKAIFNDTEKRFEMFAEVEAMLIENAIICPSRVSNGDGYVVDRLSQFEGQFAPYGLARSRYKGMHIHEQSMGMDEFNEVYTNWEAERLKTQE